MSKTDWVWSTDSFDFLFFCLSSFFFPVSLLFRSLHSREGHGLSSTAEIGGAGGLKSELGSIANSTAAAVEIAASGKVAWSGGRQG